MNTNGNWKIVLLSFKPRGSIVLNLGTCNKCCIQRLHDSIISYLKSEYYHSLNIFFFFSAIGNLEVDIILKIDVVERNGNEYMVIRDTSVTTDVSYFKVKYQYENVAAAITNLVSGLVNSNSKIVKSLMDPTINRFIGDLLQKSVLQPTFDELPLPDVANDFFEMNSTCK